MVAAGRWRALRPDIRGHAGFRLNALVSGLANASWGKLAADYLLKKDDTERLRTFVNRFLGQGWTDDTGVLDETELSSRREPFDLDSIPAECLGLAAGADVQSDRIEIVILGFGRGGEVFVLDHAVIYGLPDSDVTWRDLDDYLRQTWLHPLGGRLRIEAAAIDAGDGETMDKVLAYCGPRYGRRVIAVKGASGNRPALILSKTKRGRLFICGVDSIKAQLASRLARRGAVQFSHALENRYFEELASERRIVRYARGRPTFYWERIPGRAAEGLDATVYALAAWSLCSLDFDRRADALAAPPPPSATSPPGARSRMKGLAAKLNRASSGIAR